MGDVCGVLFGVLSGEDDDDNVVVEVSWQKECCCVEAMI
jgi:hypothetical protein